MYKIEHYQKGGLPIESVNLLRLISELEGSFQLCKYMGFEDDMNTINPQPTPQAEWYQAVTQAQRSAGYRRRRETNRTACLPRDAAKAPRTA